MTTTANLVLTLVEQSQAQKEVTVNDAIRKIDAILNTSVIDKDLTAPPSVPVDGNLYIVAATATGAWVGQEKKVAWYKTNGWQFIVPHEGLSFWVADEDIVYYYDGTNWVATQDALQNIPMLGINSTADSTNKLSVNSSAILFNNIGNSVQVKVNKNASGDSNTFLFQTGFSGRAEIGCAGDDDFHFKVSPDGSSWTDAIIINKTTGHVSVQAIKNALNVVLASQFDKTSNTTETAVLTSPSLPAGTYNVEIVGECTAGAAGGIKASIGGTATLTNIRGRGLTYNATTLVDSRGGSATSGTPALAVSAFTGIVTNFRINYTIEISVAGTVSFTSAQNVSDATTTSIYKGCSMIITKLA